MWTDDFGNTIGVALQRAKFGVSEGHSVFHRPKTLLFPFEAASDAVAHQYEKFVSFRKFVLGYGLNSQTVQW